MLTPACRSATFVFGTYAGIEAVNEQSGAPRHRRLAGHGGILLRGVCVAALHCGDEKRHAVAWRHVDAETAAGLHAVPRLTLPAAVVTPVGHDERQLHHHAEARQRRNALPRVGWHHLLRHFEAAPVIAVCHPHLGVCLGNPVIGCHHHATVCALFPRRDVCKYYLWRAPHTALAVNAGDAVIAGNGAPEVRHKASALAYYGLPADDPRCQEARYSREYQPAVVGLQYDFGERPFLAYPDVTWRTANDGSVCTGEIRRHKEQYGQ